jgi:N-acetylneuraminic acid mutarotase
MDLGTSAWIRRAMTDTKRVWSATAADSRLGQVGSRSVWVLGALAVALLGTGCTDTGSGDGTAGSSAPSVTAELAWRRLARAPSQRTEVTAAAVGTKIYVVGGFLADRTTVATLEIFDTASGQWSRGPELPVAVNHAMATTAAGTVYVFGGYLADGSASAAAFRLVGGAWQRVADLPEGRGAGTAVALDGTVYVAGGIDSQGRLAGRMLVYDTARNRWSAAPGPPTPREHLGGAGFGGRVYTVGGRTDAGNLSAFEAYDPGTRRWTRLPGLPTPRGGLAAAVTCSGQVTAVGGEAQATFAEAEAYSVRDRTWRSLPPLPTPRHGLGVVAVGADLYVLAGGPRPGLHVSDATEAIDLTPLGRC